MVTKYYKHVGSKAKYKIVKKYVLDQNKRVVLETPSGFKWDMIESYFKAKFKEVK